MCEIKYKDDVIEISDSEIKKEQADLLTLTNEIYSKLNVKDIIVYKENKTALLVAKQIVKKTVNNNVEVMDVPINDVIESAIISDIKDVTFGDLLIDTKAKILSRSSENCYKNVNSTERELAIKNFTIQLATVKGEDETHLNITAKGVGGELSFQSSNVQLEDTDEVSGEIQIEHFTVANQLIYSDEKKVEYVDLSVDIDTTISGKFYFGDVDKEFELCRMPVVFAGGATSVDVVLKMLVDAKGNISVSADIPYQSSVTYMKDMGVRLSKTPLQFPKPDLKISCEACIAGRVEPILKFLQIEVIDVEVDVACKANADFVVHPTGQICADVGIKGPIVDISIMQDDSIDCLLNYVPYPLSATFHIIKEDSPLWKKSLHYEEYTNKKSAFVKKCTYKSEDEILESMKKGDFSYFAGTYKPLKGTYYENEYLDLILHKNGEVSGGGYTWSHDGNVLSETKPISVSKQEDGSFLCTIRSLDPKTEMEIYYLICPKGVISGPSGKSLAASDSKYKSQLKNHIYIECFEVDGGVVDAIYLKE